MKGGPQPMERARRLQLAFEISERLRNHYGDDVLAIGIYGSLARGTDGPYSDIEMHCIVQEGGSESAHEWSAGPWKAEVNVYSEHAALELAAEVDVDWPITHGAFTNVLAVFDPADIFSRLRIAALSQPERVFQRSIRDVVVGELYERVGKIRNALVAQNVACLPYLAIELTKFGACLIGLANRHLYTSGSRVFEESLALVDRPDGYDALCRMAMAGELSEPARISDAVEAFWTGVEEWSSERNLLVDEQLDDLLQGAPQPREPTIDWEQATSFVRANGSQLDRLRLQRACGESFTLAEAEAVLRPYQLVDGSFDYQIREDERERVGSLGATLHCLRWVREFGLGNRSQMVRTLDFLASAQAPDGSFYETEKKLAHSPQDWLTPDAHVDRFLFTAAVPMRLFSLGYSQHPMIQPALRWLKRYWLDWELITHTHFNLWALLCLSRSPIGLSGSVYQRYYATALDWLPELDAQPLTWMLDALQGAGFTADEPLVAQGLARLSSLQSESGAWPDPRTPAETTVTALRLLHDYGFATH